MSKGVGVVLDSFAGSAELYLTATKLLRDRLITIQRENLECGAALTPETAMATSEDIGLTHMLFVKRVYKPFVAFAYEYTKTISKSGSVTLPITSTGTSINVDMVGCNGDYINDQVVRVVLEGKGSPDAPSTATRYRWCDMPGARLFKSISWWVDKQMIDMYSSTRLLHWLNAQDSDHRERYAEMLGQSPVLAGEYYHENRCIDQIVSFKDGAQTFKPYQGDLELWIPLIFDYNTDVGRSLHNRQLNSMQVYFDLQLANARDILQAADSTNTLLAEQPDVRVKSVELYSKNIYISGDVSGLYRHASKFSLIRVNREQTHTMTSSEANILLSTLKFPVEQITFSFQPLDNTDAVKNPKFSFKDWHEWSFITRQCVPVPALIDAVGSPSQQLVVRTAKYAKSTAVAEVVKLTLQGHNLFVMPSAFYNMYQPAILPGMSPGPGRVHIISFALYPSLFTPSGVVHSSAMREMYLGIVAPLVSYTKRVQVVIVARCINVLTYNADKTVSLKYMA